MLEWFRALMPKEDQFFALFSKHAGMVVESGRALQGLLEGGEGVAGHGRRIVEIEHDADHVTRDVLLLVRKSFITPFDRSDITELVQSMDDAVDAMHRVVKTVDLYEQTEFEPRMQEMGAAIVEAAGLVVEVMPLIRRVGANSARIGQLTEAIVAVEGRADDLHDAGLRTLYRTHAKSDPMRFFIGRALYVELERVVDSLEDVANKVNSIMVENL